MALGLRPEDVIVTIGVLNRVLISFIVSQVMLQYSCHNGTNLANWSSRKPFHSIVLFIGTPSFTIITSLLSEVTWRDNVF